VREPQVSTSNTVLDQLPPEIRAHVQPHLRLVHLAHGQVLTEIGAPIRHVWFPTTALIALVGVTADAHTIELATGGTHTCGAVLPLVDAIPAGHRVLVRRAGGAYRVPIDVLQREARRSVPLHAAMQRCVVDLLHQLTDTALCVAFHVLLPRLCRWLRVQRAGARSNTVDVTHEFLAQLLGVTRPKVSHALLVLEADGVIHQGVGRLHVVDPQGLAARSCERAHRTDGAGSVGDAAAPA